ncbi:MAG TPA: DHH family phosphoesterase [Aggregatilineales bacterium]|nr:DHH family phosphoesterase [Aggregatilineales bacterium]
MNWNNVSSLVRDAKKITLVTHLAPDGDAIGSLLGLGLALRSMGKEATLVVDGGVPLNLAFISGSATVLASLDGAQPDLAIALDCGDESRMGEAGKQVRAQAVGKPLINLDHHWSNTRFGDENLVNSEWAATAEGVYEWLEALGFHLTPDVAQCLLCGIVTDTLCFRTDNTTAQTLDKAQHLMASGANLSYIVQHTLSRISTSTIRLWGQVMPTIRIEDRVIWVHVTIAARKAVGMNDGGDMKDGGLSSVLLQADEAYISCVFTEKEDNKVEMSFRAVPGFDVSKVAVALGGGGHRPAAGATVDGSLSEVEARVIPLLKDAARDGTPLFG